MNLNPQELHSQYRDWWPQFDANSVALMDAINRSRCYVPRFFVAPSGGNLAQNAQAAGAYVPFVLQVPPGSWIFGIYMNGNITAESGFSMQVTDLGLSYKWFNTPMSFQILNSDPGAPYLLPSLYPVTEPGTLLCEFWSTVAAGGSATLLSCTFGAAVPIEAA